MKEKPTTGDKWFAAFVSVLISCGGLLGIALFISLEGAIWSAGFVNFLFWHMVFFIVVTIAYKFIYERVLRSLP